MQHVGPRTWEQSSQVAVLQLNRLSGDSVFSGS